MTEVRLRKVETAARTHQEMNAATLSQIKADLAKSKSHDITCEKWAIRHEGKGIRTSLEELIGRVNEISARLNKGEVQVHSMEGVCTFRASNFRSQLQLIQEKIDRHTS